MVLDITVCEAKSARKAQGAQGNMQEKGLTKFRTVVSEVSSFVGNSQSGA